MNKTHWNYYLSLFLDYFIILSINNLIIPHIFERTFNTYMQYFGILGQNFSFQNGPLFHLTTAVLLSFGYFLITQYVSNGKTPGMYFFKIHFDFKNDFRNVLNVSLIQLSMLFTMGLSIFAYFKNKKTIEESFLNIKLAKDLDLYSSLVSLNLNSAQNIIFPSCPLESEALKPAITKVEKIEKLAA